MDEEEEIVVTKKKSEAPAPKRRVKKIVYPRREPSVVIPEREIIFITPDKTTCLECTCFPKEEPYIKPKKLSPCQKSPPTLYELAASVVDKLKFPEAFEWSEEDVADWMAETVELPQYRECILDNHINGLRLLMLENPTHLAEINIHDFVHMSHITANVRKLYSTEFIRFARSIGLPPRKPLTHCTWFKSRTGPTWGIRQNWTRCDILRWMKIIMPAPVYRNHWDMVWYRKPDFPKVMFARMKNPKSQVHIPHYVKHDDVCMEYLARRKFRLQTGIPEARQLIWMEHRPYSYMNLVKEERKKKAKKPRRIVPKETTLFPEKIDLKGLRGKDLILARRKINKPKFFS